MLRGCAAIQPEGVRNASTYTFIIVHEPGQCYTNLEPLTKLLYTKLQSNVFIFTPRGYCRESKFHPNEESIFLDGEAAFDYIGKTFTDCISPDRIILYGRGYGSATAARLAKKYSDKVKGIVLEDAACSYPAVRKLALGKCAKPLNQLCFDHLGGVQLDVKGPLVQAARPVLILTDKNSIAKSRTLTTLVQTEMAQLATVREINTSWGAAYSDPSQCLIEAVKAFLESLEAKKKKVPRVFGVEAKKGLLGTAKDFVASLFGN